MKVSRAVMSAIALAMLSGCLSPASVCVVNADGLQAQTPDQKPVPPARRRGIGTRPTPADQPPLLPAKAAPSRPSRPT